MNIGRPVKVWEVRPEGVPERTDAPREPGREEILAPEKEIAPAPKPVRVPAPA